MKFLLGLHQFFKGILTIVSLLNLLILPGLLLLPLDILLPLYLLLHLFSFLDNLAILGFDLFFHFCCHCLILQAPPLGHDTLLLFIFVFRYL